MRKRGQTPHSRSATQGTGPSVAQGTGPSVAGRRHGGAWPDASRPDRKRRSPARGGASVSAGGDWRLSHVAKLLGLGEALELLERLVLDLADALAGDVERPPDLVERARVLAAEAVAKLEDPALSVGEVLEGLAQGLLGEDLRCALVR